MYNIRIKQLPKNGDQRNYSLVDRNDLYIKVNPINQDSNVKNTISAVPREEANIEAEGGETVIGDINNDGFLEHSKIVGKRHTEGGVPLNVAPGSFIFSDTKKLKIKDPEVLSIFGISKYEKGGITPAKIAQKYPMNNYMNILKDESADPVSKRTAAQMLKNNLEKLGMLALVQESMKGFPDGVPAIAESVMAGLQGQQMPGQEQGEGVAHEVMEGREAAGEEEQMRYGGMTKYQNAGTVKKNQVTEAGNPVKGFKFYNGITPVTVTEVNLEYGRDNPNAPYIKLSNGERITKQAFQQLLNKGFYNNQSRGGIGDTYTINQNIQKRLIKDSDGNPVPGFELYSGDKINFDGNDYTVINPNADYSRGYYNTSKPLRDTFDDTQGIIQVYNNKTKEYEYLEGEDLGDAFKFDKSEVPILPNQGFRNAFKNNEKIRITNPGYEVVQPVYTNQRSQNAVYTPPTNQNQNSVFQGQRPLNNPPAQTEPVETKKVVKENEVVKTGNKTIVPQRSANATPATQTVVKKPAATSGVTTEFTDEEFEYGGTLPKHQGTQPGVPSTVQGPGDKTIVRWEISNKTGRKRPVYSDGTKGEVIEYNVADEDVRTQVGAKGYDFIDLRPEFRYQGKTVGHQTAQSGYKADPESGFLYKDIKPGTAGLENYMEIHSDAINAFPGGAEAWKKTMLANPGKENAAMTHLLNYENAAIGLLSGDKPYVDLKKPGALVPGVENFNLPGIKKKPNEIPEKKTAWSCKQNPATGLKEVYQFEYEGEIPSGSYSSRAEAEAACNEPRKEEIVERRKRRRPWWIQDTMNYAAAMTDDVNYYPPALSQVDLETPGYVLKDPDRRIAAMQEAAARQTEASMNSTAGNVAGASMAAQSDQRLGQGANIIGDVENENANIVNQALGRNSQITNQEKILNANALQNYIGQSATARQNYDNALRALKWRQVGAFNQGTTNWMRHKQMEDVLFPNVGIDSITGDVYFPGGRQMFDAQGRPVYDTYINPVSGKADNRYDAKDYMNLVRQLKTEYPGYTDDYYNKAAMYQMTGKFSQEPSTANGFGAYAAAGQTLPSPLASQSKYGGKVKKQYGGTVFDFGALPLYFFED